MKKKLEMLEQLQEIDQLVDCLKGTQSGLRAELDQMSQTENQAREELAGLEARLAQLEQEKAELEANHAAELENIRRSETNMKEIKTNKEFQAVGREITAARKQATELEEQVLQKISRIEETAAEISAKQGAIEELQSNTAQRREEKTAEIARIQQDIDTDAGRREELTKEMPASLLKRYTNLREQRRGQAVAIAREGYCLGCNMHLPPQLYNSLFRCDDLITCPHCQRVLVLKQAQG